MYEEAFFALLNALHAKHPSPNLALVRRLRHELRRQRQSLSAHTVQENVSARRGRRRRRSHRRGGLKVVNSQFAIRNSQLSDAYLGPEFSDEEIRKLLDSRKQEISAAGCTLEQITDHQQLCQRTARAIADGKVVGWFQGRMEWGPRALGNRSILGDPRRADMKEILNAKIKRRESFRPFAPSILRESVAEWFEQDDDVPFMMEVFQIRAEKRALIPRRVSRRWLRPLANRPSRNQPSLPSTDF